LLDDDPPVLPMPQPNTMATVTIRDDDPRLQQAVWQARNTFPSFLNAFANRSPDDFFAIKG